MKILSKNILVVVALARCAAFEGKKMNRSTKSTALRAVCSVLLLFSQTAYADQMPRAFGAIDSTPSWGKPNQIFLYTSRNLIVDGKEIVEPMVREGGSSGLIEGFAIYDEKQEGKLSFLVKMPGTGNYASWSAKDKVTFSDGTKIGIIDFDKSAINAVNINRVFRFDASWSPDGNRLVMSGTHSPTDGDRNADEDIFVSEIKAEPSAAPVKSTRNLVRLPGIDKLPFYSPKGDWIYFAHQAKIPNFEGTYGTNEEYEYFSKKNWNIYRIGANATSKDKPEVVISGISDPDRFSFFPDGKRILVGFNNQYRAEGERGQMGIVDVEKKTIAAYKLKELKDPDHSEFLPLIPNQVALSPDGKRLAFSALVWSGKESDAGWLCIYTCDFDASNLKRVTPVDNSPLPPYKYEDPKLTAANAWDEVFNAGTKK